MLKQIDISIIKIHTKEEKQECILSYSGCFLYKLTIILSYARFAYNFGKQ